MTEAQRIFARQAREVGREDLEAPAQKAGIAIPLAEFERMSQWGRQRLKAAILVEKFAAR